MIRHLTGDQRALLARAAHHAASQWEYTAVEAALERSPNAQKLSDVYEERAKEARALALLLEGARDIILEAR